MIVTRPEKFQNMTYAKSEVNKNECLEPNRNALAQPKQKGSKAVFKVPAVPRAKSQCKPKPKVSSIPRVKSLWSKAQEPVNNLFSVGVKTPSASTNIRTIAPCKRYPSTDTP